MLTSAFSVDDAKCAHCSGRMVDADDEMVCSSCGGVMLKEVLSCPAVPPARRAHAVDYTARALGSFLGPIDYDRDEAPPAGLSGTSTFKYLKTISDYSQADDAGVYPCARLIERISEKLSLPPGVVGQSISVSKGLLAVRKQRTGYTLAAISAFSIISACRIYGVTSVGVREVVAAHRALGHNVRPSTLIKMGFDSPVKTSPMRAEEYLGRVAAHLSEVLQRLGAPPGYQYRLLRLARGALAKLDSSERGGHSPCALAATSFYAAEVALSDSERRRRLFTQRETAACVGVAEYTVREQFCELFRPRWDEVYDALRPILLSQSHGRSSRSSPPVREPLARPA